jgi:hypothetical protein
MDKQLQPAWKVALKTLLAVMVPLMVIAGVMGASHDGNPENMGQKAAPLVLLAPIVAYIIQKTRIDSSPRR